MCLLLRAISAFCFLASTFSFALRAEDSKPLTLHTHSIASKKTGAGETEDEIIQKTVEWNPKKAALIVVDMWDNHWCKGAVRRVEELSISMNKVIAEARSRAFSSFTRPAQPSTSTKTHLSANARRRRNSRKRPSRFRPSNAGARPGVTLMPTASPHCRLMTPTWAAICAVKCKIEPPWTRQIKTIDIAESDAITDSGQEVFNLLAERGIDNVLIMGVHLNMCVLGRPFGIRQLTALGRNVLLVRDMTDTMYCSKMKPMVNHFAGSDLVIEHVEKNWCPTILSTDLIGGKPFRFQEDERSAK